MTHIVTNKRKVFSGCLGLERFENIFHCAAAAAASDCCCYDDFSFDAMTNFCILETSTSLSEWFVVTGYTTQAARCPTPI